MLQEPHPISGQIYSDLGDGRVRVEDRLNGKYGIFLRSGEWLEGEITHADYHFLGFISGAPIREVAPDFDSFATDALGGRLYDQAPRHIAAYKADPGVDTPLGKRSSGYLDLQMILDSDRYPDRVPDAYRLESPTPGGPEKISVDRFIDPAFHKFEIERLWKKVWQMACREDDIPEVGDYHVYTVGSLSYLIVRTGENSFKAHQNICLHRGRILAEHDGKCAKVLRCPYHGWSWNIDGSLKEIPCEWDFPGVREDVSQLRGAQVATWGGFIFINPDPNAIPLEEFLGPVMMAHYEKFKLQDRYKKAHVVKVMGANWKTVMEAFMEAYHVIATHPQVMLGMGSDFAQFSYDTWGNWGRGAHIGDRVTSPQRGLYNDAEASLKLMREGADYVRDRLRKIIGEEAEIYSDAELNDYSFNDLFPNLHPWGGFSELAFRFRPNGNNHEEALMDVMLLAPWGKDKPKPPAAKPIFLDKQAPWTDVPELGHLASVLEQDRANMSQIHEGMKGKDPPYVWLSSYQEGKIRNFHRNYEKYLGI